MEKQPKILFLNLIRQTLSIFMDYKKLAFEQMLKINRKEGGCLI